MLVGVSKPGELEIDAKVTDFIVNVPAAGLGSGRMNVIGMQCSATRMPGASRSKFRSMGSVRVSAIELRPAGSVTIGDPVLVSALADDAGLSGVAKVEAAFDRDRSENLAPRPCRWPVPWATTAAGRLACPRLASLPALTTFSSGPPTKLATKAPLVGCRSALSPRPKPNSTPKRATRPTSRASSTTADPKPRSPLRSCATSGFPKPRRVPKATSVPPPVPVAQTVTDDKGQFKFSKIAPWRKYIVTATALIHNRNRDAQAPVAFANPEEVQPVTLTLK